MDDETQFSYEWVFQCVNDATDVLPKVFITDGDPAVNAAVIVKFPDAFHMHCIWHISQNLPKQLKGKLGSSFNDFMKDFYKAKNSLIEGQFYERYWLTFCLFYFYLHIVIIYSIHLINKGGKY